MKYILLSFLTIALTASKAEIKTHTEPIPENIECYLAADIGGTNSRVGIFDVQEDKPHLLLTMNTETKNIRDFTETMNDVIEYVYNTYGIVINHACIAAPGVATKTKDYACVHGLFDIHSKDLLEKTSLKTAIIVNDLFVVGHGIDVIDQKNIIQLYGDIPKRKNKNELRAIISAGTGVGSSTITWHHEKKKYITHAGEAGLLEFAPTNQLEYKLANHIKNFYNRDTVYWANLASGSGIVRIYSMLKLMNEHRDTLNLDEHNPKIIFQHPEDELCNATTNLFLQLFGRFARNYTFTVLPYDGLYITGGVPANNPQLFSDKFASAYEVPQFYSVLKQIPVYLIVDPHIGIYGAVQYLRSELNPTKSASNHQIKRRPSRKKALR